MGRRWRSSKVAGWHLNGFFDAATAEQQGDGALWLHGGGLAPRWSE
jgi:hypothetical protein